MDITSEVVEVVCTKCGEWFADWRHSSEDPAASARCPHCGYRLSEDHSVWQEGPWLPESDEPDIRNL